MELLRGEFTRPRKRFRIGFFLDVKCTDACLFIYRCAIRDEFLLLLAVLQRHVGPEQAIDQLALLFLSAEAGKSSKDRYKDGQRFSHKARLPKLRCVCKANLVMSSSSMLFSLTKLIMSQPKHGAHSSSVSTGTRRSHHAAAAAASCLSRGWAFCCV
jgi:hypothetical protein